MSTQLATQPLAAVQQRKDVRALIESEAFLSKISKVVPTHVKPETLIRIALTTVQKTPALLNCDQASLMQSIMDSAQLGLTPDGILGESYLVPYGNKCQLQIGYRGLIKLARQSGLVSFVVAEPVYDCDEFFVRYAPDRTMNHVPNFDDATRGLLPPREAKGVPQFIPVGFRGVYALVKYKDGEIDFEYLPLHRVEQIRAAAKAGNNGPWLSHWVEMARKSAIRALGKRLPLTTDFMKAANLDDLHEQGIEAAIVDKSALGDAVLGALADNKAQELADKYIPKPEPQQQDDGPPPPPIEAYDDAEAQYHPSQDSPSPSGQQPEQPQAGIQFTPFDGPAPTTRRGHR